MSTPKSIGVDFGATSIKIAVCQGTEILLKAAPIPTQDFDSPEAIIDAMCESIRGLIKVHPEVCAVGLGMPGWVDFDNGILGRLVNVPAWNRATPVRELMERRLSLPVALDNDANCMAYAEWNLGAGQGLQNVASITLGTGIGGGLVINGQMQRGLGAELGMTSIDYKGKPGPYGNRGGIEEYIGNNEMAADALARYQAAGIARTIEQCTPYELELSARAGDAIAKQVYVDFAEKLACLMMNLMCILAPQMFILGGGVAKANDLLLEPLDAFLKAQLMPPHYEMLRVEIARFGADAGIIGAALMSLHEAEKGQNTSSPFYV